MDGISMNRQREMTDFLGTKGFKFISNIGAGRNGLFEFKEWVYSK
jgi:hypothetical protein